MSFLLDLKIRSDHMIRCDIVFERRICYNRARCCTFRSADHINRKIIFVEILHEFHHRKVCAVIVMHVFKAFGVFLAKFNRIIIKFFRCHSRISFCKISGKGYNRNPTESGGEGFCKVARKRFVGDVTRLDRRRDFFQFIRNSFRMIMQAVFDKHHRIVVRIECLAGKGSVHIKHGDPVLFRNEKIRIVRVCHQINIFPEALRWR